MSEPWVRFEDAQLLVVSKPAGVNTHRPDTNAQDGMHEWVQRQRPGVSLSVLHRLDKATSGLLLFGKTQEANRSLSAQFEQRTVTKHYELMVDRDARRPDALRCDDPVSGTGTSAHVDREAATDFERTAPGPMFERYRAHPHTGRTHQVRVHAATLGMPLVGDDEHGGTDAARLFLHAARLGFEHPEHGPMQVSADRPGSFDVLLAARTGDDATAASLAALAAHEARAVLFDETDTNAYLWIDRHHDGFPDVRVERLGAVAYVVNRDASATGIPRAWLDAWRATLDIDTVYEQRRAPTGTSTPARLVAGRARPRFEVIELGCRYLIDLEASATSSGLFLDQRETRRELLGADLAGKTVLNAFGHTGSLSVAAAKAGAETLTLDLSKRYLAWAADNLEANDIDPADHDFIYGDAIEWMDRLVRKGRTFDLVIVDPPSSSTPRKRGGKRWVVDRDLHALVERAGRLTSPGGGMYVSTNLRRMGWPVFLEHVTSGLESAGRTGVIDPRTLPLDHRCGPGDPAYLKAAWVRLDAE